MIVFVFCFFFLTEFILMLDFCFDLFLRLRFFKYIAVKNNGTDEFIKERERYALIGDDLDFAFIELIPGVGMAYNDRHPKPPSPERVHTGDTPPKQPTPPAEEAAPAGAPALDADGNPIPVPEGGAPADAGDGAAPPAEGAPEVVPGSPPHEPEPEVKGPPPPPRPFDYRLDLPPDAAEVPFVRNYEPPSSTRSSSASGSPSPPPEAAAPAPAAEGTPAVAADAPAPAAPAAAAEAAPAAAAEPAPAAP